ncbi:hypothetical protein EK599_00975 [Vibrio sp. T187]|uniref:hypothetical protein n=1 Tax=Vibrio TaxID=662 RepID=UPI0010C9B617|nr:MULTISPECIES: hypothetical protein [Vibrio]MBW3694247.1 hypothetical protein [Vibrio sp. T187]
MKLHVITVLCSAVVLATGCVNDARLGTHVAKIKQQQTYNPNASQENLSVIPSGNGERMEGTYQVYTGKEVDSLAGNESQVLQNIN